MGPGNKGINKQDVNQEFNNTFLSFFPLVPFAFFFYFSVMAFASGGDHGTKFNHNT